MLNFLYKRSTRFFFAGNYQFHQNFFAVGMTKHGVNIARGNLERLRFFFSTVDNGRNNAARFQSARRRTAGRGPRFNFEFNLLGHVRYLSILNSDETDSSLWIRFIPSPRSSETQSTVVLNPSTGRTGVLLVVINSSILDFCNRAMATSTRTAWETPA